MWQVLGLVLLLISYLIYKNTYSLKDYYGIKETAYHKLSSPLWMWLALALMYMLPIFNLIWFIVLTICWSLLIFMGELRFLSKDNKVINKLIKFFTYEI